MTSDPAAELPFEPARKPMGLSCATAARIESERIQKRKFELFSSVLLVECEVQLQNIDSGITEHPEITPIGVLLDEFANFVFAQSPSFSHARDLELGITQADLWIESATRRGNCIRRHRLGFAQAIFRAIRRYAVL